MADDEGRCYPNPWLRERACQSGGKGEDPVKVLQSLRPRLLAAVEAEIASVDRHYTSSTADQSVYTGVAGAALLHLNLATRVYAGDVQRSRSELLQALALLSPLLPEGRLYQQKRTFLCGAGGPLAIAAVCYALVGKEEESRCMVDRLRGLFLENRHLFLRDPSELLCGHGGYLYCLLYVCQFLPGSVEAKLVNEVCDVLLEVGQSGSDRRIPSPLMYTWHSKHYLGAAHGLAGIITLLLQARNLSSSVEASLSQLVQPTVDYLLSLQFPSGNFPSSLESEGRDKLVHWCHGAPGFVHLLAHAHRVLGGQVYISAAEKCGQAVWSRGLLKKGYGLCHGVAGNGFTFLQLYRLTGQPHHLHRAIKFADWCLTSKEREEPNPDRPFSLFEGLAGKLFFMSELCTELKDVRFPALELPCSDFIVGVSPITLGRK